MSISCILNRRCVRDYTDESVTEEEINLLLTAGMYAPSAMNSKPWEFLVIRDKARLEALADIHPFWYMLRNAPLAILVMANLADYKASNDCFFLFDCAASTQNILLAAEGLSLGGVWLGLYDIEERVGKVLEILQIPKEIVPISLLPIGHPSKHPKPHSEFYMDKVHYDHY